MERSGLGFLGAGQMASAIASGVMRSALVPADHIWLFDVNQSQLQPMVKLGCCAATSPLEVVQRTAVVVIAVKPDVVATVLQQVREALTPRHLVVSIAAGIDLQTLQRLVPQGTRVVRVMPNTPCLVNHGATAVAAGAHATKEDASFVLKCVGWIETRTCGRHNRTLCYADRAVINASRHGDVQKRTGTVAREASGCDLGDTYMGHIRLFSAVGMAVMTDEKNLDAVTGLSGSGPAYVYQFIEALADGGVRSGLPRDVALALAVQTVKGAAITVQETKVHPGELKDRVTSPGGTTIAGLHALERGAMRGTVIDAVYAATGRARDLGTAAASKM